MKCFLVVIISTAECERVFSRLKLVKTALRTRLSNSTLEQILQIALNGPPLQEFIDSGLMKIALTFFFTRSNRNLKPPPSYIDKELAAKLDKLQWTTDCEWPEHVLTSSQVRLTEAQKKAAAAEAKELEALLQWPQFESDEEVEEQPSPKRKRTKQSQPQAPEKSDEDIQDAPQEDLRAERTRYGRVRKQREFLSYNHKDPNSVAILRWA